MQTNIERALALRFPPLTIFYAQELPKEAKVPNPLCSMMLIGQAATKGETVALSRDSCACPGAASGFGLEPLSPDRFPGGRECFLRFLSVGNRGWEQGEAVIRQLKKEDAPKIFIEEFTAGEGFLKTPELAEEWAASLPASKAAGPYVVIKPLKDLSPGEKPQLVTFLVDPDQLSALVVLANFARPGSDNVRIPFGAGCTCFGTYPFAEAEAESPHAIVGLTDISARFYMRKPLGEDIMSFTVPLSMYEEMESNVPESFLTRFAWKTMTGT